MDIYTEYQNRNGGKGFYICKRDLFWTIWKSRYNNDIDGTGLWSSTSSSVPYTNWQTTIGRSIIAKYAKTTDHQCLLEDSF